MKSIIMIMTFSDLPNDILRDIYVKAVEMRHVDKIDQIVGTVMTAFDLLSCRQLDGDYHVPMFEGSRDVARVTKVYDGSYAKIGSHGYSVEIEVGDECFCVYKRDWEHGGITEDTSVSMHVVHKQSSEKYERCVVETFKAMFEDGVIF